MGMWYNLYMRIDKFLKVSRLIKRREVAKELCDAGYVTCGGKALKPSSEVNGGETLSLRLGKRILTVKVLEVRPFANKEQAGMLYEVVSDETV